MAVEHNYSVESASKCGNEQTPVFFEEFDDVISQFMKDQGIPGLAVAISYHGNIVHTQGYGLAGVNRSMTSLSRFRIASISKPLTAIGVMRLVEQGQLTLADKVFGPKGILKEFRPTGKGDKRILNITIQHLLQHSAGWDRDQAGDPVFYNLDAIDAKDGFVSAISDAFNVKLVKYMMKRKLQFAPGKRHAYSNFGYLVLGMVMEKTTGMRYETYMRGLFINVGLPRLKVGCTKRVLCDEDEVEYFNNREPSLLKSIFPNEGMVLPQYGSFSMENTGSYGGWVASAGDLISILHMLQSSVTEHVQLVPEKNHGNTQKCHIWVPGEQETNNETTVFDYSVPVEVIGMASSPNGSGKGTKIKQEKYTSDLEKSLSTQDCGVNDQVRLPTSDCVVLQDYGISCVEVQVNDKKEEMPDRPEKNVFPENSSNEYSKSYQLTCSDCQTFTSFGIPMKDNYYVIESTVGSGMEVIDMKDQGSQSQNTESVSCQCKTLLKPASVSQMLAKPSYEDGKQWYGLGLDVQDSGLSFGHTGAMEGSCGTIMHHKSGFSWVLLMNSWSRDMDLDGLVKYALSTVKGYPLYFEVEKGGNLCEVTSQDNLEKVFLFVPHSELDSRITEAKQTNFIVSWISGCNVNSFLYFNLVLKKSVTNWSIHIDIGSNDIISVENQEKQRNYFPHFIDSYVHKGDISHCIIFEEDLECKNEIQILKPVAAEEYLKRRTTDNSHIICQSVTPLNEKLYVSAIIKNIHQDTVSWLQITAEEFLAEQKKQLKKGRDLAYVKFYSTGDDPFVSAVWSASPSACDRFERHGASKYGLLQELREAADRNLRLQACSSYVSEGVINFAALWKPAAKEKETCG